MKPRFWRSFWDAEWVCTLIGSLVMAKNVKISVSGFYWFCKKNLVKVKKDFLNFILQPRGLLWMVTCTESHYCAKSPSFPTCNEWLVAKSGKNKARIYTQTIPRNLVFTRLQSIDGWKRLNKKFIWRIKMGYKSFRKFEMN